MCATHQGNREEDSYLSIWGVLAQSPDAPPRLCAEIRLLSLRIWTPKNNPYLPSNTPATLAAAHSPARFSPSACGLPRSSSTTRSATNIMPLIVNYWLCPPLPTAPVYINTGQPDIQAGVVQTVARSDQFRAAKNRSGSRWQAVRNYACSSHPVAECRHDAARRSCWRYCARHITFHAAARLLALTSATFIP